MVMIVRMVMIRQTHTVCDAEAVCCYSSIARNGTDTTAIHIHIRLSIADDIHILLLLLLMM